MGHVNAGRVDTRRVCWRSEVSRIPLSSISRTHQTSQKREKPGTTEKPVPTPNPGSEDITRNITRNTPKHPETPRNTPKQKQREKETKREREKERKREKCTVGLSAVSQALSPESVPSTPVIHCRQGSPIHYLRNLMKKNHDRFAPKWGRARYCESPKPREGAGLSQYEQPPQRRGSCTRISCWLQKVFRLDSHHRVV